MAFFGFFRPFWKNPKKTSMKSTTYQNLNKINNLRKTPMKSTTYERKNINKINNLIKTLIKSTT